MTRDEIEQFLAQRQEAWKQRDVDALTRSHAEDGVLDTPFAGGQVRGRDAIEKVYRAFIAAFPDAAVERSDYLIDGDRVVEIWMLSGTNKGGFMNLPPTGRTVRFPLVAIFTLKEGVIMAERRIYDFTGVLMQAGVLKVKPS
jgi:steroid delta-isomerase-like uncharacterized protein